MNARALHARMEQHAPPYLVSSTTSFVPVQLVLKVSTAGITLTNACPVHVFKVEYVLT